MSDETPTGEPGIIVNPTPVTEDEMIKNARLTLTTTLRGPLAITVATHLRMNQIRGSDYLRAVVENDVAVRRGRGRS